MNANEKHMACDEFAATLADYLDKDLPDAAVVAMEVHASSCAECGGLLSEIETLRADAGSLPLLEPSRDLWAGIAERIDARVLPLDATRTTRVGPVRRTWRHSAVAAAALVLFTAGVTHVWTRMSYPVPTPALTTASGVAAAPVVVRPAADAGGTTDGTAQVASSEPQDDRRPVRAGARVAPPAADGRTAAPVGAVLASRPVSAGRIMRTEVEPVFDREIVKLRAIMRERRAQLDPSTVAVLEQSIAVIDSAITQSRAALAKDPASGFLATQLNHSLEKKVELLRTAALLPART